MIEKNFQKLLKAIRKHAIISVTNQINSRDFEQATREYLKGDNILTFNTKFVLEMNEPTKEFLKDILNLNMGNK